MVKIAVPKETDPNEGRVAATPDTVKRYIALGATVVVESGAGEGSRVPDAEYVAEGAQIAADAKAAVKDADIVLKVRRPEASEIKTYPQGRDGGRHHGPLRP